MNRTVKKICTGAAAVTLLTLSATGSAFAATDVDVVGNGAFSDSNVDVSNHNSTVVDQNNDTNITNDVATYANTGNNDASFNTGGSVTIYTGDASSTTSISNAAGSNVARVDGCGTCGHGGTDVVLHGNGAFSNNNVDVDNWNREEYRQSNTTYFRNHVLNKLNTGNNTANFNTDTDVRIVTGDADATNRLHNEAGSNVLH